MMTNSTSNFELRTSNFEMTAPITLQHVVVKIPVDGDLGVEPGELIPVFHRWVATQAMPELLVDVADLRHVPAGPGVILVGSEADYSLDHSGGEWGLQYRRKNVVDGSNGREAGIRGDQGSRKAGDERATQRTG